MANQRTTFAKRQREQNKKDKHIAKAQRLAQRRADAKNPVKDDEGMPGEGMPAVDGDPSATAPSSVPAAVTSPVTSPVTPAASQPVKPAAVAQPVKPAAVTQPAMQPAKPAAATSPVKPSPVKPSAKPSVQTNKPSGT
jgi:hypothetical protein